MNFDLNTENSQSFYFDWFLLCKVYNVWPKKVEKSIFNDTEEWSKAWRRTYLWFGKWHEEYGKFSPEHLKISKLGLWWGPLFNPKKKMYALKTYRGVICHGNEEWCKIWRGINLSFQNWNEEFNKFLTRALESLKNFCFNGLLLSKA